MGKFVYQVFLMPEENGTYSTEIPDLPGCYSEGKDFKDAIEMAADAGKTYIAALLKDNNHIPEATVQEIPEGDREAWVFFETDASYVVDGDVVSAAEAARELNLSAGRITHMLDAGLLDGFREGRHTWITKNSINARKLLPVSAGRPKKAAMA